ncbi:MAG: hypothetical protein EA369_09880 [Bradymonadales bacterium]|nr:MAG: hypothetical protein EA369_09880 [Bradymonadales bacterium]
MRGYLFSIFLLASVLVGAEESFGGWMGDLVRTAWEDQETQESTEGTVGEERLNARDKNSAPMKRLDRLISELSDPRWVVRVSAAQEVGRLGEEAIPAVPALTALTHDRDLSVREAAILSLGQIGRPTEQVMPVLIQTLETPSWFIRRTARDAIVRVGEPAIPFLVGTLAEPGFANPSGISQALDMIGHHCGDTEGVTRMVLQGLSGFSAEQRLDAVELLRQHSKIGLRIYQHDEAARVFDRATNQRKLSPKDLEAFLKSSLAIEVWTELHLFSLELSAEQREFVLLMAFRDQQPIFPSYENLKRWQQTGRLLALEYLNESIRENVFLGSHEIPASLRKLVWEHSELNQYLYSELGPHRFCQAFCRSLKSLESLWQAELSYRLLEEFSQANTRLPHLGQALNFGLKLNLENLLQEDPDLFLSLVLLITDIWDREEISLGHEEVLAQWFSAFMRADPQTAPALKELHQEALACLNVK